MTTQQAADTGLGDTGQDGQTCLVYDETIWPEVVQEMRYLELSVLFLTLAYNKHCCLLLSC